MNAKQSKPEYDSGKPESCDYAQFRRGSTFEPRKPEPYSFDEMCSQIRCFNKNAYERELVSHRQRVSFADILSEEVFRNYTEPFQRLYHVGSETWDAKCLTEMQSLNEGFLGIAVKALRGSKTCRASAIRFFRKKDSEQFPKPMGATLKNTVESNNITFEFTGESAWKFCGLLEGSGCYPYQFQLASYGEDGVEREDKEVPVEEFRVRCRLFDDIKLELTKLTGIINMLHLYRSDLERSSDKEIACSFVYTYGTYSRLLDFAEEYGFSPWLQQRVGTISKCSIRLLDGVRNYFGRNRGVEETAAFITTWRGVREELDGINWKNPVDEPKGHIVKDGSFMCYESHK